jgi:hypothetical protein
VYLAIPGEPLLVLVRIRRDCDGNPEWAKEQPGVRDAHLQGAVMRMIYALLAVASLKLARQSLAVGNWACARSAERREAARVTRP